jgi:hypothetical protein
MTVLLEFFARACYQEEDSFTKGFQTMTRLDSRNATKHSEARLVLNRETLRRLGANELMQAAGGVTIIPTCYPCGTQKNVGSGG